MKPILWISLFVIIITIITASIERHHETCSSGLFRSMVRFVLNGATFPFCVFCKFTEGPFCMLCYLMFLCYNSILEIATP